MIFCVFLVPGSVPGLLSLLFWFSVPSSLPALGFRRLSPYSFGILFRHHVLVPSCSGQGSGACPPGLLTFCSIVIFWFLLVPSGSFWFRLGFRLGFRALSPYSSGILFHYRFFVPVRVPEFVSLLFSPFLCPGRDSVPL